MPNATKVTSELPWFISIPRCGSNWIQGLMEVYFNKPRGPLLKGDSPHLRYRYVYPLDTTIDDLMWTHHHDQKGFNCVPSTSKLGDMFLYRDPVDYCYSCIKRDGHDTRTRHFIAEFSDAFKKWVVEGRARTPICYDDFVASPEEEFKRIVHHFKKPFNKKKFDKAMKLVTKETLVAKSKERKEVAFEEQLTPQYSLEREEYRKEKANIIYSQIITPENEPWLGRFTDDQ